jgi:hypothetical protein
MPVAFSPAPATRMAAHLQSRSAHTPAEQPHPVAPAAAATRQEPARRKGFWSSFLDIFRV